GSAGSNALIGLLPAPQGERRRRHQPIGQDREGLVARMTDSTPHPNAFVTVIVGLAEPPSMADDRVVPANRTSPWQEVQGDHPIGVHLKAVTPLRATTRCGGGSRASNI